MYAWDGLRGLGDNGSDRYALVFNGTSSGYHLDPVDVIAIEDPAVRRQVMEQLHRTDPELWVAPPTPPSPPVTVPGIVPDVTPVTVKPVDYTYRPEGQAAREERRQADEAEAMKDWHPREDLSTLEQAEQLNQAAVFQAKHGDVDVAKHMADDAKVKLLEHKVERGSASAETVDAAAPAWVTPVLIGGSILVTVLMLIRRRS